MARRLRHLAEELGEVERFVLDLLRRTEEDRFDRSYVDDHV